MLRKMILVVFGFSAFLFGQGRIIIPELPPRVMEQPIRLVGVHSDVHIEKDVARVHLTQEFHNDASVTVEGEYIYSLPGIAQVNDFNLYINGKRTKGELLDKQQASKIYNDIVRRLRDPALLEYSDYGLFKAHIFPVAAGEIRKIEISYEQVVPYDAGYYKFELPVRQSGQGNINNYALDINLNSDQTLGNIYSPSHNVQVNRHDDRNARISFDGKSVDGSKDFSLFYTTANGQISASLMTFRPRTDLDGYFMFFVNPDFGAKKSNALPKDVIFVIDVSGSMGGEKIQQARDALRFCVSNLNNKDRFEIVRFSSSISTFGGHLEKATDEAKKNAYYFIDNISANGGTDINSALLQAAELKKTKDNRPTSIVFLTDGLPTEGNTDIKTIVENFNHASQDRFRLFNFGVGYDVNTWLLDKLADDNNGSVSYVKPGESIEQSVSSLFAKISSPILGQPQISVGGVDVYDMFPQKLPDVFKDQRIMLTGRYSKSGNATLKLTGYENGKKKTFTYKLTFTKRNTENDFIARLWANRKINDLLNKIRFEGEKEEWVVSVKNLAEEFGIVTPYTSYLVREQNEELVRAEQAPAAPVSRRLQAKAKAINNSGVDDKVYESLGFMSADIQSASGRGAVASSSARQQYIAKKEQADEMLINVKRINGRTFQLKDGIWTEQGIDVTKQTLKKISTFSPEYYVLINKDPELKKIAALGNNIIFRWKGIVYKIRE